MATDSHAWSSSTCAALDCTSAEWEETYNNTLLDTDVLAEDVLLNTVGPNGQYHQELVAAEQNYRLDKLLEGMLKYAPTPAGKRYVVIAVHIAHGKGPEAIVKMAQVWMRSLFLRMIAFAIQGTKEGRSSSQTPIHNLAVTQIESSTRSEQEIFREKLRQREDYRCAITHVFDNTRLHELIQERKTDEIPQEPHTSMAAAHIIPLLFNGFNDRNSREVSSHHMYESAVTWDMLRSWISIDTDRLAGSTINTPANGNLMTTTEHRAFGSFMFYLDKDAFPDAPNKYKLRLLAPYPLSNGQRFADVEFHALPGVEPPDPEYLRIHAAFAKVIHLSGAADFMDRYFQPDQGGSPLPSYPTEDFEAKLVAKLAAVAS